jgi:hypothetical protein
MLGFTANQDPFVDTYIQLPSFGSVPKALRGHHSKRPGYYVGLLFVELRPHVYSVLR